MCHSQGGRISQGEGRRRDGQLYAAQRMGWLVQERVENLKRGRSLQCTEPASFSELYCSTILDDAGSRLKQIEMRHAKFNKTSHSHLLFD